MAGGFGYKDLGTLTHFQKEEGVYYYYYLICLTSVAVIGLITWHQMV
jgi:hypothetical protein